MKRSIFILLAFAGAASAQDTSDLQPAAPQPAQGAGSVYYPGMPVPPPPTPGGGEKAAAGKGEVREGLILDEESPMVGEEAPATMQPEAAQGTYVVRRGDTLWGISGAFFHNPWYWPKLWALNPSITNPHWIYPGDVLKLSAEEQAGGPTPKPQEPSLPKLSNARPELPSGVYLRQNGFVEPGELDVAGTIVGSKEEKIMLATLDEAYVKFDAKHPLVVGERYTIYNPIRPVKHPITGKRVGEIVEIFGDAEVESVTPGKIAKVKILASVDAIERGYRVGPLRRTFKIVPPRAADKDLQGVVVATLRPIELVGGDTLVFIDRGEHDGVELGNRFSIVRQGDGYQPNLWRGAPKQEKRFPREVLGDVLVVDLRDRLATGWVLDSIKETQVGDRVELHAGR